jgi:hypothetical protein
VPRERTRQDSWQKAESDVWCRPAWGYSATCGYQAGISDLGHKDVFVNNSISGFGYTPQAGRDCNSTALVPAFLRFIDADSSACVSPSNK